MAVKDRSPQSRLPVIRPGDPIRASYLNEMARGVNDLLASPAPARALRLAPGETVTEVEDPSIITAIAGEDGVETWQEYARETTTVRVYNEQDTEQWVDVERIDQIDFQRPDGIIVRLVLAW